MALLRLLRLMHHHMYHPWHKTLLVIYTMFEEYDKHPDSHSAALTFATAETSWNHGISKCINLFRMEAPNAIPNHILEYVA